MMLEVFILYLAAVFLVGIVAGQYSSTSEEGYFLSDRDLGPVATALSAGASDSSGWIFIGAAGFAYSTGIATMWMLPGFAIGYALNYLVVGPRLRRYTAERGCITIPDYLEARFNDDSNVLRVIASLIIIGFFIAYVAAQLTAAGKAFDVLLDVNYQTGILIAVSFTTFYTLFGGFKGVVWTDVAQGLIIMLVLVAFPLYLIFFQLGGWGAFMTQLGQSDPTLLSPMGSQAGAAVFGFVIGLLAQGLAEPGQPHILQRFMGSKSDESLEGATVIAMIWLIIVMTGSNLLGLLGRVLVPNLENIEYVFPLLVMDYMIPVAAGIVLAAIFSAIMSTTDSQMILVSQTISHDLFKQVVTDDVSQKHMVWIGRAVVLMVGALGAIVALQEARIVFWFVLYAWAGLGASFGPVLIFSLYWEDMSKWGVISGLVSGTVTTVVWHEISALSNIVYELVPAAIVSIVSVIVVSYFTNPPASAKEEVNLASPDRSSSEVSLSSSDD
jgi:SSS family solute:Na+ symporter/sodium/proline symporter